MTSRIEIEFAVPVELPDTFSRDLHALLLKVCDDYQRENPTRVMWPAGEGSKPQWSQLDAMFLGKTPDLDAPEKGEPTFDDSVYHIEIAEREDYHGNNPHNPQRDRLRAEVSNQRSMEMDARESIDP